LFTARINDGDEEDDWHVMDLSTRTEVPLKADRWFQQSDEELSS
jgi:hypothetical protein